MDYFSVESGKKKIEEFKDKYRQGNVGDVEVKKYLVEVLNNFLDPIRQRRYKYEKQSGLIDDLLEKGTKKAREQASETLSQVKKAMGID